MATKEMSSCEICADIWSFFTGREDDKKTIDLGTFDNALSSPCPDHTRIITDFRTQYDSVPRRRSPQHLGFLASKGRKVVELVEHAEHLGMVWELIAVKKAGDQDSGGIGRVLHPEWIDLELAGEWKRDCLESHGAKCRNPLRVPHVSPKWLIDTEKQCVVPGGKDVSYVALSYRWGDHPLPKLSFEELQREGVLADLEVSAQFPLIVQHALQLAIALKERYLWIDALCFDDLGPAMSLQNPDLMCSIYANATYTIIVSASDRNEGITGLQHISTPRSFKQQVYAINDQHLIKRRSSIFSLSNGGKDYYAQSWAFHDFKTSGRRLIFQGGQVHWQCNCTVQHEELVPGSEIDKYIDPRPQTVALGFPDLESLGHILSRYNEQDSTYDSDPLIDLKGLLNILSRSFEGGFLHGLPECLFDRALAWKPQWFHTELRRRKLETTPSWSWAAWQGMFSLQNGEAARVNELESWIMETIPITEWFTGDSLDADPSTRRRIRSTWFEQRERRKGDTQPLPPGWERLPAQKKGARFGEPMLYPDGCGEYVYRHHALPDPENNTWFYPFEFSDIDVSTPFNIPKQTRYLFCKTWKAGMWAYRTARGYNKLALRIGPDEPKIGDLHLQNEEHLALFPEPSPGHSNGTHADSKNDSSSSSGTISQGKLVELIAINQSVVYKKTFNNELQRYDHPFTREERMTVLWVEWKDGVAYRRAVGSVEKAAWDGLDLESVDLVLG